MRRMTFQIGSEFEANQRADVWFERAMDALTGRTPVLIPIKPLTRYEARLAALSR